MTERTETQEGGELAQGVWDGVISKAELKQNSEL